MYLNYIKRKNNKLFSDFQTNEKLKIKNLQNYNPIYSNFFSLNENNYNSINLNNQWYISKIFNKSYDNDYEFSCEIKNINDENFKIKQKTFIKMAPLLEPYKFLAGKYNSSNPELFNLPNLTNSEQKINIHEKIADPNNSSYVDSFFCYLSSQLLNKHMVINCIDFYGSFLGLKEKYKINIIDDIEYLIESDFFNKNQNKLFKIDDYSHLIYKPQLKQIEILDNVDIEIETLESDFSLNSNSNTYFNKQNELISNDVILTENDIDILPNSNILNDENLKKLNTKSLSSSSSLSEYSSRSSHSNIKDYDELSNYSQSDCEDSKNSKNNKNNDDNNNGDESDDSENSENSENCYSSDNSSSTIEEEMLFATFDEFPIQLICLECCESTFDELILNQDVEHEEIFSALMQIIMTLLIYQKTYYFTHNDLHTNNVMYIKTNKKFIYYIYNKKLYKVPTFGKIYKIIDFGRAIYKFNGNLICSDSFKNGNDASTQYNIEPYFNDKKPRLEPNYSFDLCRLACSMFDYFIEDITEIDIDKLDPLSKLIFEWCLDDKGINVLYKNTGIERYPNFKLYKMIARLVHNHTPEAQLERDEFKKYLVSNKKNSELELVINIDDIPCYAN